MKTKIITADTSWRVMKQFSGLTISGSVEMIGDDSYIRVIADDLLIFEANPLISDSMTFNFDDVCDETYDAEGRVDTMSVEINNAILTLTDINHTPVTKNKITHLDKINNINSKGLNWKAGITNVSQAPYKEWKKRTAGTTDPDWLKYY